MASRKPAKTTKPIIYYNGIFHYVDDNVNTEADDVQYASFKIHNLNVCFHLNFFLKKAIYCFSNFYETTKITCVNFF